MKRFVSVVASLVTAAFAAGACGPATISNSERLAGICAEKESAVINCPCFADSLAQSLTDERLAAVVRAAETNRRGARLLPADLSDDASLAETIAAARTSCKA
jgi:hypothetical protein